MRGPKTQQMFSRAVAPGFVLTATVCESPGGGLWKEGDSGVHKNDDGMEVV